MRHIVGSIAAVASQQLAQLKILIKEEESYLHHWLSGMAGTGKSTIARTVAQSFKEDGILGATFFSKRGEGDRGSAEKLFPTIVAQLAVHIPQMIVGIRKAIDDDPVIARKSLQEQFDKLMLQPLLAMDQSQLSTSPVVVINALDECEREEDVAVILKLLPKVEKTTCLRFRFFLPSRSESPIRFGFDQIDQSNYQNTILQNLDNEVIKHDITLYLREEFRRIRQKRHRDLPPDWPGAARINGLAAMAVPLFIFAATSPERRLQQFFEDSTGSKMDKTYQPILNQLLDEDESETDQLVEEFQKTIGVIILLATPLSLSALKGLLEMPEDDISTQLDAFHSVLTIPDNPNLPIRTFHLSFHDYLVDKRTKAQESTSRFWVDTKKKHKFIAGQCLAVMRARFVPPVLQYTCRYWVCHLAQSSFPAQIIDQILMFLEEHFLHWLEVMAISGIISECLNALDTLLELTKDTQKTPIYLFLSDARRYIYKFVSIVDLAPLQLYSSGLIFAPQRPSIRTNFVREFPGWLYRGPRVEENWSPELQTLEGHSGQVASVAFSRDGQLLASGSHDSTIKLWDPATGILKHTISAHSNITHIEFSEHLPQLNTNVGSFSIEIFYESLSSNTSEKVAENTTSEEESEGLEDLAAKPWWWIMWPIGGNHVARVTSPEQLSAFRGRATLTGDIFIEHEYSGDFIQNRVTKLKGTISTPDVEELELGRVKLRDLVETENIYLLNLIDDAFLESLEPLVTLSSSRLRMAERWIWDCCIKLESLKTIIKDTRFCGGKWCGRVYDENERELPYIEID
ncbi:hypothetical protein BDW72DRAFT_198068 [Aspergillus terricola var. indicus]